MDKLVNKNKLLYSGLTLSVIAPLGMYVHAGTIPYPNPRTQVQGTYVSGNQFMGDIDSLLPLYGSTRRFLFADLAGRYGSNDHWFVSPGGGFRGVYHNQIFGVYGFGDYQKTNPEAQFWVFNPGLEWMSPTLDVHANGYFPNSSQKQTGPTVFDNSLGNFSNVRFQGHSQFDMGTTPFLAISRGADTELGYSMDLQGYRARIFGGGYYYHSSVDEARDIRGGFAGVQLPLNKFADVLVTNSYNNFDHNHVALSLRLTWDGQRKFSRNVEDRLLDRIERHSGIIQTAASSLTQGVVQRREGVFRNNIWFFESGAPVFAKASFAQASTTKNFSSCTYEHPCNDFNQTSVTEINQLYIGANFYLKPGSYVLSDTSALNVYRGQSIYGRTADYKRPALGAERPMLSGALLAQGGNTFDSIQVSNNKVVNFNQLYFEHGVAALAVADAKGYSVVWINNSDFTADGDVGTKTYSGYTSGVVAAGGLIYLNNSNLVSQNAGTDMNNSVAYGLLALNNVQIIGANNTISSTSAGRFAYGAAAFNFSKLKLNKTTFNAEMTGAFGEAHAVHLRDFSQTELNVVNLNTNSSGNFAVGVTTNQQSTLNLKDGTIVANMTGPFGTARGAYLRQLSSSKIDNTSITANSAGVNAYGVYSEQDSVLDLNHSVLLATTGAAGESIGVGLQSKSKIIGSQNSIQAESSGFTAYGALLKNESTLSLSNSSLSTNMIGTGQAQGVFLQNYAQALLTKVDVTATGINNIVFGGLLANSSQLQLIDSTITANMMGGSEVQALQVSDNAQAMISHSKVVANSTGTTSIGIFSNSKGKFSLDSSSVIANADIGTSRGLQLADYSQGTVNQSNITANSTSTFSFGVLAYGSSTFTTDNTAINANVSGAQAQGIQVTDSSHTTLNNTKVTATSINNAAYGALVLKNGLLNLNQSTVVAKTMNTSLDQAVALSNDTEGSIINVTDSILSVSGVNPVLAQGPNISFKGANTCTINGVVVSCV